ncbi:MAG: hypothetical protein NTW98_01125 [Candidatus Nomurabacteria bacterium]|nr:hypothetical protein [Candidatus Nomurabacteria bacterium]
MADNQSSSSSQPKSDNSGIPGGSRAPESENQTRNPIIKYLLLAVLFLIAAFGTYYISNQNNIPAPITPEQAWEEFNQGKALTFESLSAILMHPDQAIRSKFFNILLSGRFGWKGLTEEFKNLKEGEGRFFYWRDDTPLQTGGLRSLCLNYRFNEAGGVVFAPEFVLRSITGGTEVHGHAYFFQRTINVSLYRTGPFPVEAQEEFLRRAFQDSPYSDWVISYWPR